MMLKPGRKPPLETVDGKGAAAKSGSRQSRRTETTAADPGRTESATADRGSPEAAAAHSNPAAPEAAAAHSNPAAAEAAAAHSNPAAAEAAAAHSNPATTEAAATAKTTTGRSHVRRQHGDRGACEQGDHHFA